MMYNAPPPIDTIGRGPERSTKILCRRWADRERMVPAMIQTCGVPSSSSIPNMEAIFPSSCRLTASRSPQKGAIIVMNVRSYTHFTELSQLLKRGEGEELSSNKRNTLPLFETPRSDIRPIRTSRRYKPVASSTTGSSACKPCFQNIIMPTPGINTSLLVRGVGMPYLLRKLESNFPYLSTECVYVCENLIYYLEISCTLERS